MEIPDETLVKLFAEETKTSEDLYFLKSLQQCSEKPSFNIFAEVYFFVVGQQSQARELVSAPNHTSCRSEEAAATDSSY